MKIKTGVASSHYPHSRTMMDFRPGSRQIEEGKLVIWINGDKGYNGLADVGKKIRARHRH
nr:maltose ABC transporter periplasmic protein [Salmonella sp. NCTC 7297]